MKTPSPVRSTARTSGGVLAPLLASGCSAGAPSFTAFGAYFPAWLACSVFGVFVALGTRIVLLKTGTAGTIPMLLLVCVCVGLIGGIALSWLWVGS